MYIVSSSFLRTESHVPLRQPSSFNGIRYSAGRKGSTHCAGCPCSRKGITRHRFLLPELHVDRYNVVARRDAWPFVRKVASMRSIYRPGRFYSSRAASTYDRSVQLRSIVVVAGRCAARDEMHARERTRTRAPCDHRYTIRDFLFPFPLRVTRY